MRFIFSINSLGTEPVGRIGKSAIYSFGSSVEIDNDDLTTEQVVEFLYPLLNLYGISGTTRSKLVDALISLAGQAVGTDPIEGEFESLGVWMTAEFCNHELPPISHFEFEMEIKHPSQPQPWKVTGSGQLPQIRALVLGGLTQYTTLPQRPLWDDHVSDLNQFLEHIPNCDTPEHRFNFEEVDYLVYLIVTTITQTDDVKPINTNLH
jgi:hypothetical protein